MALKLIEGFDHMSSPASFLPAKGWTIVDTTDPAGGHHTASFVTGRISGKAFRISHDTGASFNNALLTYSKSLPAAYTGGVVGFAYEISAIPLADMPILKMRASTTGTVSILITTLGKLQVKNSSGTVLATGTTTLSTATWYYIELKWDCNGASGSIEMKLNGSSEIASTVSNIGSTGIDNIHIVRDGDNTYYARPASATADYDDIYVLDTSASPNNDFLGDVAVETTYPDGDSGVANHLQWTPSGGGTHYNQVNEHTSGTYPDGDTSYVAEQTVGERDSYTFTDLSILAGSVYGVQTFAYARKDNSGTREFAMVARPGSTDRDGATKTLGTSYSFFTEIRETNPDTSAAWTISEINATEFGLKLVT